ncbi:VrrA/YqfQ family protein [Sporosarcina sp. 179-K 3D1 HS]|uniref:VrrA/YqfQ family protein n=1 Tax=Sporosarcina sp. 179-K 3D1 HS TaxID=3232169 RepID=UPI00399FEE65
MRYQSFYPFARQQAAPFHMRQQGFGIPPQMGRPQLPRQQFPGGPSPMGGHFGAPPVGGGMQNNSKMEAYMQTANRFLNTAQQFAPLVQQFAPMFQNLPAMWKLYKGFQSLPSADGAAANTASRSAAANAASTASNTASGNSVPRIFQPPF